MKILMMAGSLRQESMNKRFIRACAPLVTAHRATALVRDLNEFPMPVYDGDREDRLGLPSGAQKLAKAVAECDAVILSTPEYNGAIPGTLKNAIDWVSRVHPNPWTGKPVLLLGASESGFGALRGLWHSRVPFEAMGSIVYPTMHALAHGDRAFTPKDAFKDPKVKEKVRKLIGAFIDRI